MAINGFMHPFSLERRVVGADQRDDPGESRHGDHVHQDQPPAFRSNVLLHALPRDRYHHPCRPPQGGYLRHRISRYATYRNFLGGSVTCESVFSLDNPDRPVVTNGRLRNL